MAWKDLAPVLIALAALFVSLGTLATDTRGLSVVVRGAALDANARTYDLHVSLINSGTQDILFYAADVAASKHARDRECPLDDLTPGIHAPGLDDSIRVPGGGIADHTFAFRLQNMLQGVWAICVDGLVSDFTGTSEPVRFKSGAFRAIQEGGKWQVDNDPLERGPFAIVPRRLVLRDLPSLF